MNLIATAPFRRAATVVGLALASLVAEGTLYAQTAVSNLGQTTDATHIVVGNSNGSVYYRETFSFTTGGTAAAFDFTGVSVNFANDAAGGNTASGLVFGLYSAFDPNVSIGTTGLLSNLTLASGNPTLAGVSSFSGSATLAPSTTYFLKMTSDTPISPWYYKLTRTMTGDQDGGGLAGWAIQDGFYTWQSGGQWSLNDVATWGVPQFSVQASAIPEPATSAAIAGVVLLGVAVWQRRRAKVSASETR